jgi:hypothetical protein
MYEQSEINDVLGEIEAILNKFEILLDQAAVNINTANKNLNSRSAFASLVTADNQLSKINLISVIETIEGILQDQGEL